MKKKLLLTFFVIPLILSIFSTAMIGVTAAQETHDIAVVNVTPSQTFVKTGDSVNITVVIENNGTVTETGIEVKVYYDNVAAEWLIRTQTVSTLGAGASISLTSTWDTTDVGEGDHTVIAKAISVPGEDYTENNILESNETVKVILAAEQPLPIELIIGVVVVAIVVIAVVAYAAKRRNKTTLE